LICFKRFDSALVPESNEAEWRRLAAMTYPPVIEPREEGNVPCPYLHAATDFEWAILLDALARYRPDLIGVGVASSTFDIAREMTGRIHRELPGVPVIWGGPHPTIMPEESLESADMVAIGEGEHLMAELAADRDRTDSLGLWRRTNGEIVANGVRPLEQDLDRFPFASFGEDEWLIESNMLITLPKSNQAYFRGIYMTMSQRGCPFQCTYCIHHIVRKMHPGERYFRRRSVDNVLAECEQRVRDFDLEGICFCDDVFVIHPKWIEEFCEKYPKRIGLPFGGFSYPLVSTEEMFRRLSAAGMVFTGIGIQTGSDYIGRDVYGRTYSSEKIVELAWTAHKYGVPLLYEVLTSCPYEREEDALATLRLLTRMPKPHDLKIKKLVIFPKLKVGAIDRPRPGLPESTFDFYVQLYLMSRHALVPPETLLELAKDEYLKANPKVLQAVAYGLHLAVEEGKTLRAEIDRRVKEETRVTARGVLAYAKRIVMNRLPGSIAERLRGLKRRLKPAASH
jgi:radical SAM superfamily enzyme YgiQ (UPF0313 family)